MGLSTNAGRFVANHPVLIAVAFAGLLAASVPAVVGADVYLSIYELSPRGEYYDHFVVLNRDLGWDNLGAILMTLPEDRTHRNVTDPAAVREMNEVEMAVEELTFVEGALSLAKLVRILNGRLEYTAGKYVAPEGLGLLPLLNQSQEDEGDFPQEGAVGDAQINASLALALELLGDQIYGNILAPDHKSALMVVVMTPGATGEEYRAWQETLLEKGLEFDAENAYADELEMKPLSIDIIYSTLDDVAYSEGPYWVVAAVGTALLVVGLLFRRLGEMVLSIVVLVVVVAATLATAEVRGIDFNLLSILVAALIFAAGVDYCMHVIARYREERSLGYDPRRALVHTVRSSGPALLITTITTTGGFASLYFSLIPAIGDFGFMVGGGILVAFLVCMSLLPVLLVWADKLRGDDEGAQTTDEEMEARRIELEREVRAKQRTSVLGRTGTAFARHRGKAMLASALVLLLVASPLATKGVEVWGASYLEPHRIFAEETYPMQALVAMDETFGIPNELAVLYYADATDPEVVRYLDRVHNATLDVHGRTKTDSVPNVLRLYTTLVNPDPGIDRDRDGIPDTEAQIKQAYDEMREDPATSILVDRVVVYDAANDTYPIAAHRLGIDPQPPGSLGADIDNYRASLADTEAALGGLTDDERQAGVTHGTTGLVVLGVEVVDAIIRGNAGSILVMLVVVYSILLLFWRRAGLAFIGTLPVLGAVTTQYALSAFFGYEVTYVSLILTGMVMGIGVDDAVHYINRFREEVRNGHTGTEAATLASAEIGSVLVGTTLTTMAPFFVLLTSIVTWAAQTALLVIPTLLAALLVTLVTLPAMLAWHADTFPRSYGVTPGERRGADAEDVAARSS